MNQTERARAYIAKLNPAIAGNGGHSATLLAACRLVEFGLTPEEARPLLEEWNKTHCEPQWSEQELAHKLADAFKRARPDPRFLNRAKSGAVRSGPIAGNGAAVRSAGHGAAIGGAQPGESQSGESRCQASHTPSGQLAVPQPAMTPAADDSERQAVTLPPTAPVPAASAESDAAALPRPEPLNRAAPWKVTLRLGERRERKALADLRGLSVDAIVLAVQRGLLKFGSWHHLPAWFILDKSKRAAQARRLDGLPWALGNPKAVIKQPKTFNLAGSQAAWPVGIQEAQSFPSIALVEGGPDLLAAFHFIIEQGRLSDCAPVAMLGAGMTIHPLALPLFAGKRVRIFPHSDASGSKAEARWTKQLMEAGATVDSLRFETERGPVKDLNELVRTPHPYSPSFA
jgi:hypothetical protein